ncbi:hypothetical protein MtrunA17_Chr2g0303421 [Medicago truncatula]|nr:hypothetical protein MtrunA17_Chr2g0303421 [Medicago truncatula]
MVCFYLLDKCNDLTSRLQKYELWKRKLEAGPMSTSTINFQDGFIGGYKAHISTVA